MGSYEYLRIEDFDELEMHSNNLKLNCLNVLIAFVLITQKRIKNGFNSLTMDSPFVHVVILQMIFVLECMILA